MDDLTEEQLAILHQYKEILNESDEDIARATLESLGWNLHRAIEASEMAESTTNDQPAAGSASVPINRCQNIEIVDETIRHYRRPDVEMMLDEEDLQHSYPRLNPTVDDGRKEHDALFIGPHIASASSSASEAGRTNNWKSQKMGAAKKQSPSEELSLDCFISAEMNGITRKTPSSRDDSGSGSTCSLLTNQLTNQLAQASTSADGEFAGVAGASGSASTHDKESRKEKKRYKMSGDEHREDKSVSYESEDEEEVEVESIDDSSIVYLSDDDAKNVTFTDQVPLIPTDFTSISDAIQNFSAVFETRYGSNFAPFFQGTLQQALVEAFEAPGRGTMERRPLAIYLHNDDSVACNIFAQNVMCSEQASSLLKCQFIVWAWDMSQKENREKLYEWFSASNMTDVSQHVKMIHKTKYPLLLVLVKDRNSIYTISVIKGHDSVQHTVEKLMMGLDSYVRIKNKDIAEEQNRLERETIRREQLEEYEKSLAMDRAKQEELAKTRQREREEELQQKRQEEEKLARQTELASTLPAEPAETGDVIAIRVRCPDGKQMMRRFSMDEPLSWLITYVESLGFDMESHQIWTSDMPKKNVSAYDVSKNFRELGWSRREQVVVDEK